MNRNICPVISGFLAAILLASCAQGNGSSKIEDETAKTEGPEKTTAENAYTYNFLCDSMLFSAGATTDEGFYDLVLNLDGTGNIIYYDYATRQCVYLSDQINSLHRDESDTSFFESFIGGADILSDGNYLYILKQTNRYLLENDDKRGSGYIYRMDLDGNHRKAIPLPANMYIYPTSGIASVDSTLCFLVLETQKDSSDATKLIQVDFEHNKIKEIMTFSDQISPFLVGSCESGLIFSTNDHTLKKQTLQLLDFQTMQLSIVPFDADNAEYRIDSSSGNIYYIPSAKDEIWAYNIITQTNELLRFELPMEKYDHAAFAEKTVDNKVLLKLSNTRTGEYKNIALDLCSGKTYEQELMDGDHPVSIYGVAEDSYLVMLSSIEAVYQDYTPDNVPVENTMLLPHFALIKKEDYWLNRPNYHEFDNQVYRKMKMSVR